MKIEESRNTPCVLVVESDVIIGMSLADDFEDRGYQVAGPFTCAGALRWLETSTPHAAVLDVDLQSGTCVELARKLRGRGIRFLVFSSHNQGSALEEFRDVPWIPMPAPFETLTNAVGTLNQHQWQSAQL